MVRAWHGRSMASVNQTRPHCVNQMGKTHSKLLAARHGRGTVWARHGHGMLCVNRPYECRGGAQLVEAVRFSPNVAGHWDFSLTLFFRPHCGPGVDSAYNRKEYQAYLSEVKAAVA
jgi:hypothetical protein